MAIYYYQSKGLLFLEQWIDVDMDKVVIMILEGSVVTQTVLGGLNIHSPVINFIQFICAKKLWKVVESRLSYCNDKKAELSQR